MNGSDRRLIRQGSITRTRGAWEQPPRGAPWVSGLVGHFVQTWPDSELLSHSAVLRLKRLELTLQSLSPVLALYDPIGVDVPLNCDTTTITRTTLHNMELYQMPRLPIPATEEALRDALFIWKVLSWMWWAPQSSGCPHIEPSSWST